MRLAQSTFLSLLLSSVSLTFAMSTDQVVLGNLVDPPSGTMRTTVLPTLSDILTVQSKVSIFHSYLRELREVHERIQSNANSTLLAPTNKAVMALPRKPHLPPSKEDNTEDMPEISEMEEHRASQRELRRWISAHVIPSAPLDLTTTNTYPTLLDDVSVSFHKVGQGADDDALQYEVVVDSKRARIVEVKEAHNGMLYIIEGTVPIY